MQIHSGRASSRSAARMIASAPSDILSGAGGGHAVSGLPGEHPAVKLLRGRPALGVQQQIGPHLSIGLDQGVHGFGMHRGLLPGGGGGNQCFNVEFVRVQQQTNQRHLIVRLVADVADDEDARVSGEVINVRRRQSRARQGTTGHQRNSREH